MTDQDTLTNPFPGLRPFESEEEHLFFGRDGQSDELLRRLRRSRFLAVLGTSGSGKSSLVRAGLLPSLYGGIMTKAGSDWRVALFRPGHDPIGNLAKALNDPNVFGDAGEDEDVQKTITEATLRRSALGLVETTRQARMPAHQNLLVVVDQFEEVFRFRRTTRREGSEDDAAAFIKLLIEATRQTNLPIYIVITMRSDFLGDCSQFRDLPEAINDGQYLIPRMTRDQRREAITGPVAVGGGEMSPRLVNRLLNDVGDNPDQLPILQHALMRTWDFWIHHRRDGEPIDLNDYEAVGTMTDALSRHADEAYNELPDPRSRTIAEKLFKGLTEKGPDNREIRRPTPVKEICAVAEASVPEVIAVIERFRVAGRSFLMPPTSVALGPESLIDISHESLIRGWERLRKWVDEEARSAQIYRRLAETAALHQEGKAGLWHDPDLALALIWRQKNRPNAVWAQHYNPNFDGAMAFLAGSKNAREAEIAEKERHRKREIRRTRIFATVLGVAFLMSLGFLMFANTQRVKANAQTEIAKAALKEADNLRNLAERRAKEALASAESEKKAKVSAEEAKVVAQKAEGVAKQAEEDALKAAQAEKKSAQIAEQKRKEAQAQRAIARQEEEKAKRSAEESARAAVAVRRQNLNNMSSINMLVDRLIELTSPQEAAYWRSFNANAFTELGRHDLSKEESTKVLDVFGENLSARINRGYMSLVLLQPEAALTDFERARDLDPQSSLNHLNLGVAQANLKDYDAATKSIRNAIHWYRPMYMESVFDSDVSPDIKNATQRTVITADGNAFIAAIHYELANLEAFKGGKDFEARLAEADRHAENTLPSIEAYLTALNWAWYQQRKEPGDYGAFAAQAHLWRKAGYDNWAKYSFLRFQCEHQKQHDPRYTALANWVNAQLKLLPGKPVPVGCPSPPTRAPDARARLFEAEELATIGRYEEAVSLLDGGVQDDPANIELLLARARYRKLQGDRERKNSEERKNSWRASQQDFEAALKLVETNVAYKPYVYLIWAFMGREMGLIDDNQKKDYLQKALALGPADYGVLSELSDLIAKSDPNEALVLLERSLRLEQSAVNYYKLAKLQNDIGRHKEALESIKLALSLRDSNADYYKEREKEYQERERAEQGLDKARERTEAGLRQAEVERRRHLAAGYNEIGDTLLKQLRTAEANRAYKASLNILTDLAKLGKNDAVSADLAVVNSNLSRLLEAARTATVPEFTSCRILSIKGAEGPTREVTIDRGSEDGLTTLGADGSVLSVYSKNGNQERKIEKIGRAKLISVGPKSSIAVVTMDNPSGNGLVRPGDMVELRTKVPTLLVGERSVLWSLAKYHITFTSEDGRAFFDYRTLYADENDQLIDQIFESMLKDIRETAKKFATLPLMSKKIEKGRFKDKTLREVMDHPTRQDLLDYLNYVMKYPAEYYGQDKFLGGAWGDWALEGASQ